MGELILFVSVEYVVGINDNIYINYKDIFIASTEVYYFYLFANLGTHFHNTSHEYITNVNIGSNYDSG